MSRLLRRALPIAALCVSTLLGGCIVDPGYGGYRHGWYGHDRGGWGGWGHRGDWRR
jgi:hypothetical protein